MLELDITACGEKEEAKTTLNLQEDINTETKAMAKES